MPVLYAVLLAAICIIGCYCCILMLLPVLAVHSVHYCRTVVYTRDIYVIEVADSQSDLGLHGKALVSEILAFYHLLKYARGRPGRRGHVHLGQNCFDVFKSYEFLEFIKVLKLFKRF